MRNDQERVVMHYNKYSAWTVIKVLVFCLLIAHIVNANAYLLVGFNHVMAKAIGLASDAVRWCENCLQAIQ